jgi:alkanesulfonate monooxygenase SsuD/methylene tetrahydromethanopterin reductase-like flavin-dependent oxidoreductase (luciferase family)
VSPSFDLGFLIFLNYRQRGEALESLEDGLRLFEHAETLGYDSGWVRVHHNAQTLTAPFPFLTAAALRTRRLRLGTAVIPVGEEDPIRFAENAATTDLLSGGRLELGLSSGIPAPDADPKERERVVGERLSAIRSAVRGSAASGADDHSSETGVVASGADESVAPLPHGPVAHTAEIVALPHSPGLDERLWYGAGGLSSTLRAARLGLNLVLSTLNNEAYGPTLGHGQAELIKRYRDEFAKHHPGQKSRVAIARSILPIVNAADRSAFGALAEFYDHLVTPEGRYTDSPDFTGQASPLYSGEPADIVERLGADPSLSLADTVLLAPLSELDTTQKEHVFENVVEHVAADLGWRRSAAVEQSR